MRFRMFTDYATGKKIAVNVDAVRKIVEADDDKGRQTVIFTYDEDVVFVREDYSTVLSRLNTIAE